MKIFNMTHIHYGRTYAVLILLAAVAAVQVYFDPNPTTRLVQQVLALILLPTFAALMIIHSWSEAFKVYTHNTSFRIWRYRIFSALFCGFVVTLWVYYVKSGGLEELVRMRAESAAWLEYRAIGRRINP